MFDQASPQMRRTLERIDCPDHLFNIRELDFSDDLFAEPLNGSWFILGAETSKERRDGQRVEQAVSRQSVLIPSESFTSLFDKLESIGNVLSSLGKPTRVVRESQGKKDYSYWPFHRFEFPFTGTVGEPLVFLSPIISGVKFFINPDLWMFFELEEKNSGSGIWWDPRRGEDVLVRRLLDDGRMETVEIRTEYLMKYLRARQSSLLVGHYRHLHFFDPPPGAIRAFVEKDVVLGSPAVGAKAILQNWGLRTDCGHGEKFLQRRLHLWFEIRPPELDRDDPWTETPSFDPYSFTLSTSSGSVAPARWKHMRKNETNSFSGTVCDFMDRVYFRQEVLGKYEGKAGFEVQDDGSVRCGHYWSLVRSTSRFGNELVATAIGDFAEGVPFEEWPHWKQYAVEPPSPETGRMLAQEIRIPEAVNSVMAALDRLDAGFAELAAAISAARADHLWRGSTASLACRAAQVGLSRQRG